MLFYHFVTFVALSRTNLTAANVVGAMPLPNTTSEVDVAQLFSNTTGDYVLPSYQNDQNIKSFHSLDATASVTLDYTSSMIMDGKADEMELRTQLVVKRDGNTNEAKTDGKNEEEKTDGKNDEEKTSGGLVQEVWALLKKHFPLKTTVWFAIFIVVTHICFHIHDWISTRYDVDKQAELRVGLRIPESSLTLAQRNTPIHSEGIRCLFYCLQLLRLIKAFGVRLDSSLIFLPDSPYTNTFKGLAIILQSLFVLPVYLWLLVLRLTTKLYPDTKATIESAEESLKSAVNKEKKEYDKLFPRAAQNNQPQAQPQAQPRAQPQARRPITR